MVDLNIEFEHGAPRPSLAPRPPLDEDLAAEVAKQAVYAAPGVKIFRWDAARRTARVEIEASADAVSVEDKLRRFVSTMVARYRPLPKHVLRTNARKDSRPLVADIEEQLAQRGFLRRLGPGQVGLSGPPLAFVRALDARLSGLAHRQFGAREDAYPALIPTDVLHRCGYFGSFPHAVSMVTHLGEDFDAIERFRQANKGAAALVIPEPAALVAAAACLSPAVCYHLYQSLEGASLGPQGVVVTAMGRCFRYESKNLSGLERLWDFTMREVIGCGTEAAVAALREALVAAAGDEAAALDLDFTIESANDPFFSATYSEKTYWQARNALKFELMLPIPPAEDGSPRRIAAASFNLHEDFFGRTFSFVAHDGQPAFTGCGGWGLERWALAAFAQHGLDAERWPAEWRREVFA
jgi:seryl-tRNA synthetase